MSSRPRSLVLATLLVASAARAAPPGPLASSPRPAAAVDRRGPELVRFRFGWPAPAEARVTYRRARARTGERPTAFVARYTSRVERAPEGLVVRIGGTRWEGDLPLPREVAGEAIRASERVTQRIRSDGAFDGLEGAEATRPVLARLLAAKLPPDQAERAVAAALAAMRAESEELWNLAVGFWIDAELELAAPYEMQSEGELPLLPGLRATTTIEFQARRRVPCDAAERAPRCVEVTLREVPEAAAVARARQAIAARLLGPDAPPDALEDAVLESELFLVTDPATLLPHRLVWTKSLRAGGGERGAPALELVERSEYDYRYGAAGKPAGPARRPKRHAPTPAAATSARR
ncbi:hypothetical protein [Anaeromyxobacter oryzisoli]|uniref:hypothetical protein n=1 Tax=Anaeromyxobacter oryzisoli TaxID=2925408 RepID=UPI001F59BB70|nr:hypothetical protein [Anaeromyxobacter sp. SG63]